MLGDGYGESSSPVYQELQHMLAHLTNIEKLEAIAGLVQRLPERQAFLLSTMLRAEYGVFQSPSIQEANDVSSVQDAGNVLTMRRDRASLIQALQWLNKGLPLMADNANESLAKCYSNFIHYAAGRDICGNIEETDLVLIHDLCRVAAMHPAFSLDQRESFTQLKQYLQREYPSLSQSTQSSTSSAALGGPFQMRSGSVDFHREVSNYGPATMASQGSNYRNTVAAPRWQTSGGPSTLAPGGPRRDTVPNMGPLSMFANPAGAGDGSHFGNYGRDAGATGALPEGIDEGEDLFLQRMQQRYNMSSLGVGATAPATIGAGKSGQNASADIGGAFRAPGLDTAFGPIGSPGAGQFRAYRGMQNSMSISSLNEVRSGGATDMGRRPSYTLDPRANRQRRHTESFAEEVVEGPEAPEQGSSLFAHQPQNEQGTSRENMDHTAKLALQAAELSLEGSSVPELKNAGLAPAAEEDTAANQSGSAAGDAASAGPTGRVSNRPAPLSYAGVASKKGSVDRGPIRSISNTSSPGDDPHGDLRRDYSWDPNMSNGNHGTWPRGGTWGADGNGDLQDQSTPIHEDANGFEGSLSKASPNGNGESSTRTSAQSGFPENPDIRMQDIPHWLKSLRLHKYIDTFKDISFDDMLQLTNEDLEQRGVTAAGARRKLLLSIEKLQTRDTILRDCQSSISVDETFHSTMETLKHVLNSPGKTEISRNGVEDFATKFINVLKAGMDHVTEPPVQEQKLVAMQMLVNDATQSSCFSGQQQRQMRQWQQELTQISSKWNRKRSKRVSRPAHHSLAGSETVAQ
eukprot:Clim_evm26s165 gene=Clim_evmTU26s165